MKKGIVKSEIPPVDLDYHFGCSRWGFAHTHDFWEFSIVMTGEFSQVVNGKLYSIKVQQAILTKPTDVHRVPTEDKQYTYLNILFTCEFLKSACDFLDNELYDSLMQEPTRVMTLSEYEMHEIRKIISELNIANCFTSRKILLLKRMLLSYVLQMYYKKIYFVRKSLPNKMQNILDIFSDPNNIALRANAIAEKTHYSYSYLARLFKENMGVTLTEYSTQKKMEYANKLLIYSDMTILDIADQIGYGSLSQFMSVYKKTFGETPGKTRKKYIESGRK